MNKGRIEAFSDGVVAIILTIMVLELKAPQGTSLDAVAPLMPVLFSYLLSFVFVGTYWVNHHHMFQAIHRVDGRTLWLNLHLLFWLSLIPFGTAWLSQTHFATWPVAFYGCLLLGAAVAYYFLARNLAAQHGPDSALAQALGADFKGKASLIAYALGIPLAFVDSRLAYGIFIAVAIAWLVPDSRIEKRLSKPDAEREGS